MATADNLLMSALHGTAWRAAVERRSIADAVAEIRVIAGGRTDLIAETAGLTAGSWLAWPEIHVGHELVVAGLLVVAAENLDYDLLAHWVEVGYERGLRSRQPVHGAPIGHGERPAVLPRGRRQAQGTGASTGSGIGKGR